MSSNETVPSNNSWMQQNDPWQYYSATKTYTKKSFPYFSSFETQILLFKRDRIIETQESIEILSDISSEPEDDVKSNMEACINLPKGLPTTLTYEQEKHPTSKSVNTFKLKEEPPELSVPWLNKGSSFSDTYRDTAEDVKHDCLPINTFSESHDSTKILSDISSESEDDVKPALETTKISTTFGNGNDKPSTLGNVNTFNLKEEPSEFSVARLNEEPGFLDSYSDTKKLFKNDCLAKSSITGPTSLIGEGRNTTGSFRSISSPPISLSLHESLAYKEASNFPFTQTDIKVSIIGNSIEIHKDPRHCKCQKNITGLYEPSAMSIHVPYKPYNRFVVFEKQESRNIASFSSLPEVNMDGIGMFVNGSGNPAYNTVHPNNSTVKSNGNQESSTHLLAGQPYKCYEILDENVRQQLEPYVVQALTTRRHRRKYDRKVEIEGRSYGIHFNRRGGLIIKSSEQNAVNNLST